MAATSTSSAQVLSTHTTCAAQMMKFGLLLSLFFFFGFVRGMICFLFILVQSDGGVSEAAMCLPGNRHAPSLNAANEAEKVHL